MSLETEYPHIYKELEIIRSKLEDHYKDICDFEFTIQNGKVYLLNVRKAKRTGLANLKSSIDFFLEKKIDLKESLSRINPTDVSDFLKPNITNKNQLTLISRGLGTSPCVATGKIVFSTEEALLQSVKEKDLILVRIEISPDDLPGIKKTNGILTSRGGMTSHASLVTRQLGKCCVCGANELEIDYRRKIFNINGQIYSSGEWITIDGISGNIYKGKAKFEKTNWKEHYETEVLLNMIETGIKLNDKFNDIIGKCWAIRDLLLHNISVNNYLNIKKHYLIEESYKSFSQPSKKQIDIYRQSIKLLPSIDRTNYSYIVKGFYVTLARSLSNAVGIGNHFKYFRPLLDPMKAVTIISPELRTQLIAYEYYDVNKYIHHYIDVYNIKMFLIISIENDNEFWFLDHTNISGESLVANSWKLIGIKIFVNDVEIKYDELPLFYNLFRKREYYWNWYESYETSYQELVDFLKEFSMNKKDDFRLNIYAHKLGLLENNKLSATGFNLIK